MSKILVVGLVVAMAAPSIALDFSPGLPAKKTSWAAASAPDPAIIRQGGDTIADALRIPIPTIDLAGTTVGYSDDYDIGIPYGDDDAPDVVYSIVPDQDQLLDIDLCGSQYDTKIWVYDEDLELVRYNDDFYAYEPCGVYVSKIWNMEVTAGVEYFVVIDGCCGDSGEYLLDIVERPDCELDCPPGAALEGEPPLHDGYVDNFNGGCDSASGARIFQPVTTPVFCGVSGYWDGHDQRDTDWLRITIPASGVLEITAIAEQPTLMGVVGPHDCVTADWLQFANIHVCLEADLTVTGQPGSEIWFVVGVTFMGWNGRERNLEYDYILMTNVDVVATENVRWSAVKALFE